MLDKYPATLTARYMAKVFKATSEQIMAALTKLGAAISESTLKGEMTAGDRGWPLPTVEASDVAKLKAALPPAKAAPKKLVSKK